VWILILIPAIILLTLFFFLKKKKSHALKPNNFNPPKKSLRNGSYIIEAYCQDKDNKLFFITLNYDSWEEACKVRNGMLGKEAIEINYNDNVYKYTVITTKICQVGLNGR